MKLVPAGLAKMAARQALVLDKNSPQLLFGAGVIGMVGSTVLACKATLKLDDILTKANNDLETAKTLEHSDYSERDRDKDIQIIRVRTAGEIVRAYGPAIVLGGASIAALAQSNKILNRRNVALTAAYTALERGFAEYRARVVAKYGEEEDRHLRYGTREVDIIEEGTGKKKTVLRVGDYGPSIYAKFFDQTCPSWSKEQEYNIIFLKGQQNYFNDLLHARGHVFLNEVYRELGIPHTQAGSVVGWILTPDREKTDNYIDFGIFNGNTYELRDFVNGREGSILLDFNVDGLIYDKIDTPTENLSWQMG